MEAPVYNPARNCQPHPACLHWCRLILSLSGGEGPRQCCSLGVTAAVLILGGNMSQLQLLPCYIQGSAWLGRLCISAEFPMLSTPVYPQVSLQGEEPRVNNIVEFGSTGYLKVRERAGAELGEGAAAMVGHVSTSSTVNPQHVLSF